MQFRKKALLIELITGIIIFIAAIFGMLIKGFLKERPQYFFWVAITLFSYSLITIASHFRNKLLLCSGITLALALLVLVFPLAYFPGDKDVKNILTFSFSLCFIFLFACGAFVQFLKIKKNEAILETYNHHIDFLYFEVDMKAETVYIKYSNKFKESYGLPYSELVLTFDEIKTIIHPEDYQRLKKFDRNNITSMSYMKLRVQFPKMRDYVYLLIDELSQVTDMLVCIGFDISRLEILNQHLTQKTEEVNKLDTLLEKTFETTKDLIAVLDLQGNVIVTSKYFDALYPFDKEIIGKNLFALNEKYGHTDHSWFDETLRKGFHQFRTSDQRNGQMTWIQWNEEVIRDASGKPEMIICTGYDITEVMNLNLEFEYQSRHDAQTGLLNREGLLYAIYKLRNVDSAACFYIDLSNFASINDYFGIAIGDDIIKRIALELKQYQKDNSLLARITGDQFVLMLINPTEEELSTTIKEMRHMILKVYHVGNISAQIKKSIGYALCPKDSKNLVQLISLSGMAMKEAASNEHNVVVRFDTRFLDKLNEKIKIASKLRDAIDSGDIDIHFQNIIDVNTNDIIYLEALARWKDRDLGYIPPNYFIKTAVESNLIDYLEDYLVATAIKKFKLIKEQPKYQRSILALNLSPSVLLRDGFSSFIDNCLESNGLSSEDICIEITENTFVHNIDLCNYFIQMYKEKGFRIAIDDFGREYSSLAILDNIDYDIIKIDGTFIHNLNSDKNLAIIKMIIEIAQMAHKTIIAEGVETSRESQQMRDLQCYLQQGFFFHKPEKLV
ncbi:MAG: EAL domain-containing protein [Acholeplasmataceae bacterium]|nr:EAL domain-containing protein [Acholeplasmataceae bacterium]